MAKEEPPTRLGVGKSFFDGVQEALRKIVDLLFHHGDFLDNVCLVGFEATDPAQVRNAFIVSTFGEQPARRLFEPQTSNEEDTCRDELDGEGNQPLLLA